MPWLPDEMSPVGDRFAASTVSRNHPNVFEGGNLGLRRYPGLVLASAVQRRISCIYVSDGGSNGRQCGRAGPSDGCLPGCSRFWCGEGGRKWNCVNRPSELKLTMEIQDSILPRGHVEAYGYNELVISTWPLEEWEAEVPDLVEAIFVQVLAPAEEFQRARDAHAAFMARYPESVTPFVTYDPRAVDTPFMPAS